MNKTCCSVCGFPLNIQRKPIILTNDVFSFIHYKENTCEGCGHQKDGSTIPVVHELIQRIITEHLEKRKSLFKFIREYEVLTQEERREVCPMDEFITSIYSWRVVYVEVIHDTKLGQQLLASIDWEVYEDEKND